MNKPKMKSRVQRWAEAAQKATEGLDELVELQGEYLMWEENLPENLKESALGEKLVAVLEYDLESALYTANEAADADLPLGFGRDSV